MKGIKIYEDFSASSGDIKIGDRVMIPCFEGEPTGVDYTSLLRNVM